MERLRALNSFDPTDPALMTPESRLAELADILAAGVRRLCQRGAIPVISRDETADSERGAIPVISRDETADSEQICLAGCAEGRPDGPCG